MLPAIERNCNNLPQNTPLQPGPKSALCLHQTADNNFVDLSTARENGPELTLVRRGMHGVDRTAHTAQEPA